MNTSGVRYGLTNGMPSDDILKLYKQCGGEIITLGSDAHKPEDIAFQFSESLQLLQSIGFKYYHIPIKNPLFTQLVNDVN